MSSDEDYGKRRLIGLIGGVALFLAILLLPSPPGMSVEARKMAAISALMAVWWITEATHIAVTALIPIAAFPLLGIMKATDVASHYSNHLVFLYLGGFVIALGMEKWNLHRRVALATIARVGTRPAGLVLGFMIATAFISMWVSNTATTMMMLPVAMAVAGQVAESAEIDGRRDPETPERIRTSFGLVLLLGVAYAASIGGVGTIVGTPTNVAMIGFASERFTDRPPISFLDWMIVGVPVVIVFIPVSWLFLCRLGSPINLNRIRFVSSSTVIEEQLRDLGPMSRAEKIILSVSAATAFLWIFRQPVRVGSVAIPGWSTVFPNAAFIQDSTVAMLMAVLLCLIPVAGGRTVEWKGKRERFMMDWDTIQRGVPWGVLFLFGGGFALAEGMGESGLATWIGSMLAGLKGTPSWIIFPLACVLAVVITEMTSNVATVLMLCPVLAEAAIKLGIHPYLLLIPTTIMASFAFMLPVATPPNAVVFSSGWITIPAMFRAGLLLDLLAVLIVPVIVYVLGMIAFGFG